MTKRQKIIAMMTEDILAELVPVSITLGFRERLKEALRSDVELALKVWDLKRTERKNAAGDDSRPLCK